MRLVIFDMDGTLVDSAAFVVSIVNAAFASVGYPARPAAAVHGISGLSVPIAFRQLAPDADAPTLEKLMNAYYRHYARSTENSHEPLFDGTLEAIARLRQRPGTVLAVATGKGLKSAVALLDAHGIREHFVSVETPDDNRGKPDPQMIKTAMAKAGASPAETVMVGDTTHDMKMARAAGVGAIGVAWGYHAAEDLTAAGADIVIDRFEALDAAIDKLLGA